MKGRIRNRAVCPPHPACCLCARRRLPCGPRLPGIPAGTTPAGAPTRCCEVDSVVLCAPSCRSDAMPSGAAAQGRAAA
jgi:hypothetical protein